MTTWYIAKKNQAKHGHSTPKGRRLTSNALMGGLLGHLTTRPTILGFELVLERLRKVVEEVEKEGGRGWSKRKSQKVRRVEIMPIYRQKSSSNIWALC